MIASLMSDQAFCSWSVGVERTFVVRLRVHFGHHGNRTCLRLCVPTVFHPSAL